MRKLAAAVIAGACTFAACKSNTINVTPSDAATGTDTGCNAVVQTGDPAKVSLDPKSMDGRTVPTSDAYANIFVITSKASPSDPIRYANAIFFHFANMPNACGRAMSSVRKQNEEEVVVNLELTPEDTPSAIKPGVYLFGSATDPSGTKVVSTNVHWAQFQSYTGKDCSGAGLGAPAPATAVKLTISYASNDRLIGAIDYTSSAGAIKGTFDIPVCLTVAGPGSDFCCQH